MRVIVHHPARTEPGEEEFSYARDAETGEISVTKKVVSEAQEVPESVSIYRLARIDDLVNPMTGETTPKAQVAAALLERAKEEFPDCECKVEYRTEVGRPEDEDHQIIWSPTRPSSPQSSESQPHAQELSATQGSGVTGGEPQ